MRSRCRVIHAIEGRVRIRSDRAELFERSGAVEAHLRDQPGVGGARLNAACCSVVLHYEHNGADRSGEMLALVKRLTPKRVAELPEPGQRQSDQDRDEPGDSPAHLPITLSSSAAVLGMMHVPILTPLLLAGASVPIFQRAWGALRGERTNLNVDVLDASATTLLALRGQFSTAAVMVWLVSLGDFLRDFTRERSAQAIEGLYEHESVAAWVVRGGRKVHLPVEEVEVGDEVVIYPGEIIPLDGTVLEGTAAVDQRMLTGESMPVTKGEGDEVFAGTVATDGKVYIRAQRVGEQTRASQIKNMILGTASGDTRSVDYASRFADRVVPWSLGGAAGVLVLGGNVQTAASLLIIDFGTGIRVAGPMTVLCSMTQAARHGILIKGGRHLERLAEVDALVLDKTGTLTVGLPKVACVVSCRCGLSEQGLLAFAAAADLRLNHPVAVAVVRAAEQRGIPIPERESSDYTIGQGVRAQVKGAEVLVGNRGFLEAHGVNPAPADQIGGDAASGAMSRLFVAIDGEAAGLLLYADPLREEAAEVLQSLRRRGMREIVMLTGDRADVAEAVAQELGITRCIAETFPEQKAHVVRSLQAEGYKVAVVGDGVNDSAALAQGDVGIAVSGSSEIAHQTADVALLEESLWSIPEAIDIARSSVRLIRQSWNLNLYPNCAALVLSFTGYSGAILTTAISNGAAILAGLNGLRPLIGSMSIKSMRKPRA